MNLVIAPSRQHEKAEIGHLLQLHLRDLASYTRTIKIEAGIYAYPWLEAYWTEDLRHPYSFRVDGEIAGFVFVRQSAAGEETGWDIEVAEFFVRHRFRRLGVGREAIRMLREWHPGAWLITWHRRNAVARAFWMEIARIHGGSHLRSERVGRGRERIVLREPFAGEMAA